MVGDWCADWDRRRLHLGFVGAQANSHRVGRRAHRRWGARLLFFCGGGGGTGARAKCVQGALEEWAPLWALWAGLGGV